MANYREPFEDFEEFFKKSLADAGLETAGVDIKILANDKLKEIGKVRKANNLVNYLNGYDAIIEFNEEVFERLDEHQRQIVADELVAQLHFDTEADKLNIINPDVKTFSGLLSKYGVDVCLSTKRSVNEIFSQLEDEKEGEKQSA